MKGGWGGQGHLKDLQEVWRAFDKVQIDFCSEKFWLRCLNRKVHIWKFISWTSSSTLAEICTKFANTKIASWFLKRVLITFDVMLLLHVK